MMELISLTRVCLLIYVLFMPLALLRQEHIYLLLLLTSSLWEAQWPHG